MIYRAKPQIPLFATPAPISNQTGEAWVAEIEKDFGYDLAIMLCEDFITYLIDPLKHLSSVVAPGLSGRGRSNLCGAGYQGASGGCRSNRRLV